MSKKEETFVINDETNFEDFIKGLGLDLSFFNDFENDKDDDISNSEYYNEEIDDIMFKCSLKYKEMSITDLIDGYLKVMHYLMDFALGNEVKTIDELDKFEIVSDFLINTIGDFEEKISDLDTDEYDLKKIIKYLDRFLNTFELDSLTYENTIRTKCLTLFKLGKYKDGEMLMLDYIKENPKSGYAYVELVDNFKEIGDLEKAKYYYDMGMKTTALNDKDVLEERKDYYK